MNYREYINSDQWKQKKHEFIEHKGVQKCYLCKVFTRCDLHHRTYRNLFHEPKGDLRLLCRKCHTFVHTLGKIKRGLSMKRDTKLARKWTKHCSRNRLWAVRGSNPERFTEMAHQFFRSHLPTSS